MNNERSKVGSVVLATLGCVLALTLGWLLFGENEAAPVLERETQPVANTAKAHEAAALTSPEQTASQVPSTVVPQGRTAVEQLPAETFVALQGRVVSRESGVPLENALIKWLGVNGQEFGTSKSSEDGTFESSVPAAQVRQLRVEKDGFESLARTVEDPSEFLELRLEAACELLVQLVVLGARDWDEVQYQLWLPAVKSPKAGPVATQEGDATLTEVRFKDLAAGTYELTAHVPGCGWAYRGNLTLRSGESLVVPLEVAAGVSLSGRVTLEGSHEPVAATMLAFRPKRQGIGMRVLVELASSAETNADGYYQVEGLTPGEHVVLVQNSGLVHKEVIDLPNSGATEVRDIVLPPVASLSGQVRDRSGKGVAGIGVLARVPISKARSERAYPGRWYVESESDGQFQFPALPHGFELYVEACFESDRGNPMANFFGESLKLRKGEQRANYLVLMHPLREVFGVVVGDDGERIAGARLDVFAEARGTQLVDGDLADDTGQFRIRVFTPKPSLAVSAKGYLSRRVPIEPQAGTEHSPIRIELKRISPLTGVVLDQDGNGVPSARVEITRPKIPGEPNRSQRGGRRSRTDEFGRFSAGGLAEGRWVVSAGNSGWIRSEASTVEVELPTDEPVTLVLTRDESASALPATVRGVVRFTDGSLPVEIRFDNLRGGTPVIDGDRFELTGVRPGRALFEIVAEGAMERRLAPIELASGGIYDLGTIELDFATDLRVIVRGDGGQLLEGARVILRTPPDEREVGVEEQRVRIRKDPRRKRYRRYRTPRGRYQLSVRHEGYKPVRRILELGGQSPITVEVELTASN